MPGGAMNTPVSWASSGARKASEVLAVDEVDDDGGDRVLLGGFAFGDEEGQGDEGVVGQALAAVGAKRAVCVVASRRSWPWSYWSSKRRARE
jgi:hypothetical protein